MSSTFDIWTYVARLGAKIRPAADPFFADGDAVCQMRTCQYFVPEDDEELLHEDFETFQCSAPGCKATFTQLIDSEVHYATKHRHSCSVCNKSLPSNHLLELHVLENHDTFFQLLAEKKPSYACFLETCTTKFWNGSERREHCIKSHDFPANFKFDSSKKKSSGQGKKKGKKKEQPMEIDQQQPEKSVAVPSSPAVQLRRFSYGTQKSHEPSTSTRRFSLNYTKQISLDSSRSQPNSPEKRGPVSLARMGERLSSSSSTSSARVTAPCSSATASPMPQKRISFDARTVSTSAVNKNDNEAFRPRVSTTGSKSNIPQLIRKSFTTSSPRRFSSTSSSSPEQSKILKSSQQAAMHPPRDQLNNNSNTSSPVKSSKIPVRTSSVKVPKEICFGYGVNKSFTRRSHWFQKPGNSTTLKSIEKTNFDDMKMALD